MLFPVYWMVNVSFTRDQDMRKSPPDLFPATAHAGRLPAPSFDQQLPYLGTSLVIGLGTVALTVALAAPGRLRAGQTATARRRDRSTSSC